MFTKESFDIISCTDIPKEVLLTGVLEELIGREYFKDDEFDEQMYSGDIFETIADDWSELKEDDRQILRITK
jgi:hypothetical protein